MGNDDETVYTIDELRAVIMPLVSNYGMRSAALFGSYARGEAMPYSDVDVLVDRGEASSLSVFGVAEGIREATGKRPDVFDVGELAPGPFRDSVMAEAVAL